jgi:hypothetical protein
VRYSGFLWILCFVWFCQGLVDLELGITMLRRVLLASSCQNQRYATDWKSQRPPGKWRGIGVPKRAEHPQRWIQDLFSLPRGIQIVSARRYSFLVNIRCQCFYSPCYSNRWDRHSLGPGQQFTSLTIIFNVHVGQCFSAYRRRESYMEAT